MNLIPSLPDVEQDFLASVVPYVDALGLAIAAAEEFAAANRDALAAVTELQAGIDALHGKDINISVNGLDQLAGIDTLAAGLGTEFEGIRDDLAAISAELMTQTDLMDEMVLATAAVRNQTAKLSQEEAVLTAGATAAAKAIQNLVNENRELGLSEDAVAIGFAAADAEATDVTVKFIEAAAATEDLKDEFKSAVAAIVAGAGTAGAALDPFVDKVMGLFAADQAVSESLAALAARMTETAAVSDAMSANYGVLRTATGATAWSTQALGERMAALGTEIKYAKESSDSLTETLAATSASLKVQADAATADAKAWLLLGAAQEFVNAEGAKLGQTAEQLGIDLNKTASSAKQASTFLWLTGTQWHWLLAGSAEYLAVAIPGTIALAAGLAVASQGAQNAYSHFTALYDVLEAEGPAFNQTVGSVLGLHSALQQAQNAANPGVYEILGSVVNDLKGNFQNMAGVGLQVVHMWDEFAARVTIDLHGAFGAEAQGLMSGMFTDLEEFGQILGNLGHALVNFAADMPGLARVLLLVADGLSRVIELVSDLPAGLITTVMIMEEFFRWGGLVLNILVRMTGQMAAMGELGATGFITRFAAALITLVSGAGLAIARLGMLIGEETLVGGAMVRAGEAVMEFAEGLGLLEVAAATAGVALVAGLAVALDKVRNSAQKTIAATDKAIASAQGMAVFQQVGASIAKESVEIAQQEQVLHSYNNAWQQSGQAIGGFVTWLQGINGAAGGAAQGVLNVAHGTSLLDDAAKAAVVTIGGPLGMLALPLLGSGATQAASQIDQLTVSEQKQLNTARTTMASAQSLASVFHLDLPSAMSVAVAAGVNLKSSIAQGSLQMAIAVQQIRNYEQGLGDMGAPAGKVGADMQAMGIQSQLAATKVSGLNQAWDAWISSVTGDMNDFSQVQTALMGMSKAALSTSASVTGSISSITRAVKGSSYTLHGWGAAAMQSWQQFEGAITSGNSLIDQLQTGMAEGAVGTHLFASSVKALVGEMLPFTEGNKAAVQTLSELGARAGGPVTTSLKTLAAWAGVTGKAARDQLGADITQASLAMGNMSKVAQNLSAVVGQQLDASFAAAINQASGLDTALTKYANDMAKPGVSAKTLAGDLAQVGAKIALTNKMVAEGTGGLNSQANAAAKLGLAFGSAATHFRTLGDGAGAVDGKLTRASQNTIILSTSVMHSLVPGLSAATVQASGFSAGMASLANEIASNASPSTRGFKTALDATLTSMAKMGATVPQLTNFVLELGIKTTVAGAAAVVAAAHLTILGAKAAAAGSEMSVAAQKAQNLVEWIAQVHSKNVNITATYSTIGSIPGGGGQNRLHAQTGATHAQAGAYLVGERGPELVMMRGGESIIAAPQTRSLLTLPTPAGSSGTGGAGGGAVTLVAHITSPVYLDGRQVFTSTKTQTAQYNIRNSGKVTGKMRPGT